jgi:hypothetical protein
VAAVLDTLNGSITVAPAHPPTGTALLFMRDDAPTYAKLTGVKPGAW